MRTEIITDTVGFVRLADAWRALETSEHLHGPFTGFSWQLEWWRALGGGRQLRIVVAREGDDVVGICPLFEEQTGGIRRLAFIGSAGGGGDYLDVLTADPRVRARLLHEAAELEADLLDLEDVESTSALISDALAQANDSDRHAVAASRFPCPFIPIRATYADYLTTVARRENLRRREKWFAAQPGFRIECETSPESVAPFLARFHRLHAARWSSDGGSQAFADARLSAFHRQIMARYADEGCLRLWTLWVAGEATAVAYTFDQGTRSMYYQSGFLPAWGAKSAGLVLFARYVEDAFTRGCSEVDLLRGSEPYKAEWTREARATINVRWALSARGRAWLAWRAARNSSRELVKRAIPEQARVHVARLVREARMTGT